MTKLTPVGNSLVYSTYLGGSGDANNMQGHGEDSANGIAVDAAGAAYVTGFTQSTDFPTQSAYQPTFEGGAYDAFVTKLTPAGSGLAYSTYLGGNETENAGGGHDQRSAIAVDAAGSAYVAGYTSSTNFPTQSAFQATFQGGAYDVYVTKLTPAGNALVYSTYLGGGDQDQAFGIAVDGAGAAYVTGRSFSTNFPTQAPLQSTFQGVSDAFVTKLQLPVAVTTNPPGLAIVVDGVTLTAPQAFDWASGTTHTISTTSPQQSGGKTYTFENWSDGGAQSHSITTASSVTTYTALFTTSAVISGVVDSASYRPAIAPNSFVSIFGSNFTTWTGDWSNYAPGGVLPASLGGVQVLIDGKSCFVSYVSPGQVNVLTPLDTASGSVSVEVDTAQGTATSTAAMAQVAPALFGYTLSSGTFYAVAVIANSVPTTIVAPVGTFGSATPSRPAEAGDYVVLYAIGMGSTNPAAPSGVVLPTAYPVSDLSSVKVTFGSANATVLWAGMTYAGEFQVNVQVPPGISPGDQPVVMTVGGVSTQPKAYLNFQ
ncbi:MAG: SBBP repeat-containing protein [Bryobacteraceae bacterium]